jgi:hypothetical protein
MNEEQFKEAIRHVKKYLPPYIKFDVTVEHALRYHIVKHKPDNITEQFIKEWIQKSYSVA